MLDGFMCLLVSVRGTLCLESSVDGGRMSFELDRLRRS